MIGDVAKGSPAEAAGLKEGDIVIAINSNFTQNMNQMKKALQTFGKPLKMIVQRDGELIQKEFKVKNILH
jgi:predicted metalloprotease with PDZ domain